MKCSLSTHSALSALKNVSAQALSYGTPGRLMLCRPPIEATSRRKAHDIYWKPRSVQIANRCPGSRFAMAFWKAATASCRSIVLLTAPPTIRRLNKSMKYTDIANLRLSVRRENLTPMIRQCDLRSCFIHRCVLFLANELALPSHSLRRSPVLVLVYHTFRLSAIPGQSTFRSIHGTPAPY